MWILDTWRKDCRTVLSRLRGENANLVNQSVNQSISQSINVNVSFISLEIRIKFISFFFVLEKFFINIIVLG